MAVDCEAVTAAAISYKMWRWIARLQRLLQVSRRGGGLLGCNGYYRFQDVAVDCEAVTAAAKSYKTWRWFARL